MPDVRCPSCQEWAPRIEWSTAPGEVFPFTIVCPGCGETIDVATSEYRLSVLTSVPGVVRKYG